MLTKNKEGVRPLPVATSDDVQVPRHRQAITVAVALLAITAVLAIGEAGADDLAATPIEPVGQAVATPTSQLSPAVGSRLQASRLSTDAGAAHELRVAVDISDLERSTTRSVASSDNTPAQADSDLGLVLDVRAERSVEDGQDQASVTVRLYTQLADEEDDGGAFLNLYCDTGDASETVCDAVDTVGPVKVRTELEAGP